MSSVAELLADAAPALVHELEILLRLVLGANDPADAIAKAQRVLTADAADAATDAALRAALNAERKL